MVETRNETTDASRSDTIQPPFDASFRLKLALLLIAAIFLLPLAIGVAIHESPRVPWHQASMAGTGLAPDPTKTLDAVVQVYAAKTFGWRGAFSVHTWIIVKPSGSTQFKRFDVVGWGGSRVVRENYAPADALWYGVRPEILLDVRGQQAERLIPEIEVAVAAYPFADTYRMWPGPNSNTFTAYIARHVPDLRLDLPEIRFGGIFLTARLVNGVAFCRRCYFGLLDTGAGGLQIGICLI